MSEGELNPEVLKAIVQVNDDYLRDDSILFKDESANAAEIFKQAKRFAIKRKTARKCVVPKCSSPSIRRSHTIQKASLERVAERRHVLAPAANHKSNRVEMETLGINRASVFPGFCVKHEQMFGQFERLGRLEPENDLSLQIYRSVCREIVRLLIDTEAVKEGLEDYLEFRRRKLEALYRERAPNQTFSLNKVMTSDPREDEARRPLASLASALISFTEEFEPLALAGLSDPEKGLCTYAVMADESLPVCLSGHGNFHLQTNEGVRNVRALLLVLPQGDETIVSISVLPGDRECLALYLSNFEGSLGHLCMVESWMMHGTDHWFISPSVWAAIRQDKRRLILDDILDVSGNIGCYYQHTIFNELKRRIIIDSIMSGRDRVFGSGKLIDQELPKFSDR
jgi:hypothetical protein